MKKRYTRGWKMLEEMTENDGVLLIVIESRREAQLRKCAKNVHE